MAFGAGEFGSVAFGATTTVGGLQFSFTPTQVPRDGGSEVVISGDLTDGTYTVHFGPDLNITDPVCYSGVSGQGNVITVVNQRATVWVPPNPVGVSGFTFIPLPGGGGLAAATGSIINVTPHPFRDKVLATRALMHPRWRTSYRDYRLVERPQQ